MAFRKYLYHPERAPAGRLVEMEEDPGLRARELLDLEALGWVDTPAKFAAVTADPAPVGDEPGAEKGADPAPAPRRARSRKGAQ